MADSMRQMIIKFDADEASAPTFACTSPTGEVMDIRDGFHGPSIVTDDGWLLEMYHTKSETLTIIVQDASNQQRRVVCICDATTFKLLRFNSTQLLFTSGSVLERHVFGKPTVAIETGDHNIITADASGDMGCVWFSSLPQRLAVRYNDDTHHIASDGTVIAIVNDAGSGKNARAFVVTSKGTAVCRSYEYDAINNSILTRDGDVLLGSKGFGYTVTGPQCAAAVVYPGVSDRAAIATMWCQGDTVEVYLAEGLPNLGKLTLLSARRIEGTTAVEVCITLDEDRTSVLLGTIGPGLDTQFVRVSTDGRPVQYAVGFVAREWIKTSNMTLLPESDAVREIDAARAQSRKFLRQLTARDTPSVGSEFTRGAILQANRKLALQVEELKKAAKKIVTLEKSNKDLAAQLAASEHIVSEIAAVALKDDGDDASVVARVQMLEESTATVITALHTVRDMAKRLSERTTQLHHIQFKNAITTFDVAGNASDAKDQLKVTLQRLLATQDELLEAQAECERCLAENVSYKNGRKMSDLLGLKEIVEEENLALRARVAELELETKPEVAVGVVPSAPTLTDALEARVMILSEELRQFQHKNAELEKKLAGRNKAQSLADSRQHQIGVHKTRIAELEEQVAKLKTAADTATATSVDVNKLKAQLKRTSEELVESARNLKTSQAQVLDLDRLCQEQAATIDKYAQTWEFTKSAAMDEQLAAIKDKAVASAAAEAKPIIDAAVEAETERATAAAITAELATQRFNTRKNDKILAAINAAINTELASKRFKAEQRRMVTAAARKAIDAAVKTELATERFKTEQRSAVESAVKTSIDSAVETELATERFKTEQRSAVESAVKTEAEPSPKTETETEPEPEPEPEPSLKTETEPEPSLKTEPEPLLKTEPAQFALYDGSTGWDLHRQLQQVRRNLLHANQEIMAARAACEQRTSEYNALLLMLNPANMVMPDGTLTIYVVNYDGSPKLMDDGTQLSIRLEEIRTLATMRQKDAELMRLRTEVMQRRIEKSDMLALERQRARDATTPPTSPNKP